MRNTILIGIALVFLMPREALAQAYMEPLKATLQTALDEAVRRYELPGATFSLLFNENTAIMLASGVQDKEKNKPMLPGTRMLSGSTGKLFVGAIALRLVQEGKIRLQDPVAYYLGDHPWYRAFPNQEAIRIENLLNHTSGLPRYLFQKEFLEEFVADPKKPRDPRECILTVMHKEAVHPVGQGWAYSDTNFILLGIIIEKVTERQLYDLIDEQLIKPLELKSTTPLEGRRHSLLAQGYTGPQNPFKLPGYVLDDQGEMLLDPGFEWAGGGFVTTPGDLSRLVKYIHEGDYLQEPIRQKLKAAVSMASGMPYDEGYGLGSFVWGKMNDTRYGHSGFFPGYVSHVEYAPKRNYAIALQINHDGAFMNLQQIVYDMEQVINDYLDAMDESQIERNFLRQEHCWNQQDILCYMQAYAKRPDIRTISSAGVTSGYAQILEDYRRYFPKDRMGKLHFEHLEMKRLADDLYFVTGQFNLEFEGDEARASGWFSVNMIREKGQWLILSDHSS